jgi:hypothetical protein
VARIRTIKPEFWADEKLGPMSMASRLTFLGLISMADDMGRVLDNAKQIDAFVFPFTDDSTREALVELETGGRIRRGTATNGQRVIQIVNWHHQKIDKPNFASCLPAIAGDPDDAAALYRRSRRIPERVRDDVWERDKSTCQSCGKSPLRRLKTDRYDAGPDLGEIDHRDEAADGGDNSLSNLQLLCLPCNRKKAGANVTRRNVERSATLRGDVDDTSTPRTNVPGTDDQRPGTDDRGPTTDASSSFDAVAVLLDGLQPNMRTAWAAEIAVTRDGMHGAPLTADQLQVACREYVGDGHLSRPSLRHFRAYLAHVVQPPTVRAATGIGDDAAWSLALEIVGQLSRHEIKADEYQALPSPLRAGLKAIGGWTAVRDARANDIPFRRRDFLTSYRAAERGQSEAA